MFRGRQREIAWTVDQLQEFETRVASEFEQAKIRGPVHLSYGNEAPLIDLFQYVNADDWVFSTWRNHYHALLHGVPADYLMDRVLKGHSIDFQAPDQRFYTSAIVAGIVPIAVGTALALKWSGEKRMVWCFVGDMTAESGTFYEALKYSARNELPIHFVIEDNGLSTNTPTQASWGTAHPGAVRLGIDPWVAGRYLTYYQYERTKYPHQGVGKWISF